ncbi:MAG TPA: MFS transporter [Candidatus Deferrimicrobium sp.]|nr:MFS transporter [Candidatus Deferrimicrobium sp.]
MWHRARQHLVQFDGKLWVLSVGWFVSAIGFAASIPFISIYFHDEFGLSISQIGLFFGVMAVIKSVLQVVGGEVSDRVERSRILIMAQLFRAAAFLLLAGAIQFHWGFWWCAVFMLVNATFGAIFQPVANAVVSDILPPEKRLDGYAITRTAGNLGWAAGPAIGGFLSTASYSLLFVISSSVTLLSGFIFLAFLRVRQVDSPRDRFKLADLIAIREDPLLARHAALIFFLYLVVAQLIAPFSVYAVEMVGISKTQLGYLYTLNGLLVVALQIPLTRFLSRYALTSQLACGAFLYAVGYAMVGFFVGFPYFILAILVVTLGEMFMSPPSLALTSRLAPPGRMGRYMGVFGFFVTSGWSFGPLYGGLILDGLGNSPALAWLAISSLALVPCVGYLLFRRRLPVEVNAPGRR